MIRNTFISLQKGFLTLMSAALLFSCSNVETFEASDLKQVQEKIEVNFDRSFTGANLRTNNCDISDVQLNVGNSKSFDIGHVYVHKNDAQNKLFVTVSINDNEEGQDWFILKSHLFIGSISSLGKKNPAPGQFKNKEETEFNNGRGDKEQTFEFSLSEYLALGEGSLDFALHADLVKAVSHDNGATYDQVGSEGAWGNGIRFNDKGNWSMYFQANINKQCSDPCDPTWSKLTGEIDRTDVNGNLTESEEIYFDLFGEGQTVVGNARVRYQSNGQVQFRYNISSANVFIEEASFHYDENSFTLVNSLFTERKVSYETPITDTNWIEAGTLGRTTPNFFGAFYVKLTGAGVCD